MKNTGVAYLYDHYRYSPQIDDEGRSVENEAMIGRVRAIVKPFKSLEKAVGGRVRAESTHIGLFHNKTDIRENDTFKRNGMVYKVLIFDFNSGIETDMIRVELEGMRDVEHS